MLEVELDIFSGMPNPVWTLTEKEEAEMVNRIIANPLQIAPVYSDEYQLGLGYRGMIVRLVKPDDGPWSRTQLSSGTPLPYEFRVGVSLKSEKDTLNWLLGTSEKPDTKVTDFLREVAAGGVQFVPAQATTVPAPDGAGMCCASNYLSDNRAYFNEAGYIDKNNCYCFASNHRANLRWAKPGCRGGRPMQNFSLSEMGAALAADGWRESCQTNTLSIALAVWPNTDFHFYRLVSVNAYRWAHKPGATAARDTDNSGKVISEPATCNRGNYTSFYGYWYQNNNTAYVAQC
jgi:hypothetical protein